MTWWVLTKLQNITDGSSLVSLSETNVADHLFMYWSYNQPRRQPIYRRVRGTLKFCGWKYIWDTPNLEEQLEYGDTKPHTFYLPSLLSDRYIYYLLFAPGGPYDLPIQSALITYWIGVPPEPPRAILLLSEVPKYITGGVWAPVEHEILAYDYGAMDFRNGVPEIKITATGLYRVGFQHWWIPEIGAYHAYHLKSDDLGIIKEVWTTPVPGEYEPAEDYLRVDVNLAQNDYLGAYARHPYYYTKQIRADPPYTPRFWAQRIG